MRLGFDIDGVIADLGSALRREAARLSPEMDRLADDAAGEPGPAPATGQPPPEIPGEPTPSVSLPSLTVRQHELLWREVRGITNFWETLDEMEAGAIRRLSALAREQRWEVMFLTSRPSTAGDLVQVQTQRWLERQGFALPSAFVVKSSRGKIAAALDLDVVVDDRPDNCLDVISDSRARAILVWPGGSTTVPANARRMQIGVVQGVGECLDLLADASRPGRPAAGVMGRLRHLLGLAARDV